MNFWSTFYRGENICHVNDNKTSLPSLYVNVWRSDERKIKPFYHVCLGKMYFVDTELVFIKWVKWVIQLVDNPCPWIYDEKEERWFLETPEGRSSRLRKLRSSWTHSIQKAITAFTGTGFVSHLMLRDFFYTSLRQTLVLSSCLLSFGFRLK